MACFNNCSNSENLNSLCALRRILNCIGCLNTQDLIALRDIVDRILDGGSCDCIRNSLNT
ncbi:MAG: hypothetical protein ACFWUD_00155 [Thermocaproicibacter melissae]|jgi:hypothetical protein|uniref:hypothetical protein n=1 Tax=Thermocaproicibacter melissae TaxID=2966552 RepID=UPI0024B25912|nr:hypothetical protein [Thermocaproicibacter melissae]WBY64980.1 hypothetical protein NOG13_04630 [Thermocaproicibacter melissae]